MDVSNMSSKDDKKILYKKGNYPAMKTVNKTLTGIAVAIIAVALIAGVAFTVFQGTHTTNTTAPISTTNPIQTTSSLASSSSVTSDATSTSAKPQEFSMNFAPAFASAQPYVGLLGLAQGVTCVQPSTPVNMTLSKSTVNVTEDNLGGNIGGRNIWSNSTIFFTTNGEMEVTSTHTQNITLQFNKLTFYTPQGNGQIPNLSGIIYTYSNSSTILWRVDCSGLIPSTNIDLFVNVWAWVSYNQTSVRWTFWLNGTTYLTNDGNNGSIVTVPVVWPYNPNNDIHGSPGPQGFGVNDTFIFDYATGSHDIQFAAPAGTTDNATGVIPAFVTNLNTKFYVEVSAE